MTSEFQGKRVLVTGGARGLGEAVVRQFVGLGATVFVIDVEEDLLKKLKEQLPEITTIALDLQDWEGTRKAVQEIAPIHHLVNNAGIAPGHNCLNVDEKTFDSTMNVNFKAVLNVSQVMVQGLIENKIDGGTIVNVSSVMATVSTDVSPIYSCSKAAVSMLTQCMAIGFGEHNVRVNSIRPTLMETGIVQDPAYMQGMKERVIPLQIVKRLLQTDEASELIVFLSSKKSSMITAEDVVIDGGLIRNVK